MIQHIIAFFRRLQFLVFHVLRHKEGRSLAAMREVMFAEYHDWEGEES